MFNLGPDTGAQTVLPARVDLQRRVGGCGVLVITEAHPRMLPLASARLPRTRAASCITTSPAAIAPGIAGADPIADARASRASSPATPGRRKFIRALNGSGARRILPCAHA